MPLSEHQPSYYPAGWEDWSATKREKWYFEQDGKKILEEFQGLKPATTNTDPNVPPTLNALQEHIRRKTLAALSQPRRPGEINNIPQGKVRD